MAEPEFDRIPAPLRPPVVFDQQWCNVSFLHWPVQPAAIAGLFPPGCRPDTVAGLSYVGLVPFQLRDIALGRSRAIPYFGTFAETNVRLYSVDDAGRHGVVFCSLDTAGWPWCRSPGCCSAFPTAGRGCGSASRLPTAGGTSPGGAGRSAGRPAR